MPPISASTFSHRIAVANIATRCNFDVNFALAIQNDNARNSGKYEYGAIGGGASITEAGIAELQKLGDIRFEEHIPPTGYDARMVLSANTREGLARLRVRVLRTMLAWARAGNSGMLETSIGRELLEELVEDAPGIISRHALTTIEARPIGWRCGTVRSSSRGPKGVDTTPFYLCHLLKFTEHDTLWNILNGDPLKRVRIIRQEELRTTANGTREGRTVDGRVLFSNVFPHELVKPF